MATTGSDFGRELGRACAARGLNSDASAGRAYVYVPGAKGMRFHVSSDAVRPVEGPLHDERNVDAIAMVGEHASDAARVQWQVECVMQLVEKHMGLARGVA